MKPLALMERALEGRSQAADVVLDLFLGSGSTLIGCERTARTCYGLELGPRYVDVPLARWASFAGKKAVKQ
jgi:DNA modification methylase